MKPLSIKFLIGTLIEILMFFLIGIVTIKLYSYPLKLNRLIIFIGSMGFFAILLYNISLIFNNKVFIVAAAILTIVFTPLLFKNPTFLSFIHHISRFALLSIMIYIAKNHIRSTTSFSNVLNVLIIWILVFTLFYIIVFTVNGIIIKYRHNMEMINLEKVIVRSLKFGPFSGLGIGLGNLVVLFVFKEKP